MQQIHCRALLLFVLLVLASACGEQGGNPVSTGQIGPARFDRKGSGSKQSFNVWAKKNGKAKRYRVNVSTAARRIDVETMGDVDNCQAGDPTCVETPPPCTAEDPFCGRLYAIEDATGETEINVNTGEPAYGMAEGSYGPYFCPAYVDDPAFEWRGHKFKLENSRARLAEHLPTNSGIPKAKYTLAQGPWYSKDGKAVIWSGSISGSCFIQDVVIFGIRHTTGWMAWYKFDGDAQELSTSYNSSGFTYASTGGAFDYDAQAALAALDHYLSTGECTGQWVIVIDGRVVC